MVADLLSDQIVVQERHAETVPELVVHSSREGTAEGGEVIGVAEEVIVEIVGPIFFVWWSVP